MSVLNFAADVLRNEVGRGLFSAKYPMGIAALFPSQFCFALEMSDDFVQKHELVGVDCSRAEQRPRISIFCQTFEFLE